uniref:Profilin n=1 Tax=Romanomermis culicivorax TaxID=13658 RepID=A0A915JPB6_ROMCU
MTSSWQDLVNNNLIGTKKVSKAAILGLDGQIWAKSDDFGITDQEAQVASKGFANRDGVLGSGLRFENEKYFVLQADEDRIIGRKESRGFFLHKTNQSKQK